MPEARRTFGPVVLVGLASSGLAAAASAKQWVGEGGSTSVTDTVRLVEPDIGKMPLAAALALVVLATWGVLLVTRGQTRRVVAAVGGLAAAGLVATVVAGFLVLPGDLRDAWTARGTARSEVDVQILGWFWIAAVASVIALLAQMAAVRFAPGWPAMGAKYDAPGARAAPPVPESDQELWKALSEGRDPTD